MKIRKGFRPRAGIWLLAVLLAAAVILNVVQAERVHALSSQVSNSYQKAFYETVTLTFGMESALEKLLISSSASMEQQLLGDIARQADSAQDNLSLLPDAHPAIAGALKFVNQAGDYARTLSDRLAQGDGMNPEDHTLIATLHGSCIQLNEALADMTEDMLEGENPFENMASVPSIAAEMQVEPAVEYPSLLYDGPFSDGRVSDQMPALGSMQYTDEQGIRKIIAFLGENRVQSVEITGEGVTPVPCYEMTVQTQEGNLELALTKQGGEIVYMVFSGTPGEAKFSQVELIDIAHSFLKSKGYPNLSVSYWTYDDELLTINFAAVQDGVILYPDLIKAQMDASTGLIVGLEAVGYLSNHTRRANLIPTLSEAEAEEKLSPLLNVDRARLCVIPTDSGEALAYEFSCLLNDMHYLVYIDAHTGIEREIYRIIEDDDGQLAI